MHFKKQTLIIALCAALGGGLLPAASVLATDHGDTALFNGVARNDARITDFFALNRGEMLAFIIDTNPTIGPPNQSSYIFPTDVTFKAFVDNHSAVSFDDPVRNTQHGGTVVNPSGIRENFAFTFTFDQGNNVSVRMSSPDTAPGISGFYPTQVSQGDLVYVLGSGFTSGKTGIKVNGRAAPFSHVISDNVLVFVAPNGGKTGNITLVTDGAARVTSASALVINPSNVSEADANVRLQNIVNNSAANAAIQAGDVLALNDIGVPVQVFAGLRDDPFIRTAQTGKNIAAMAVELPQSLFTHGRQKVLLAWGSSGFDAVTGASSDTAGRSFGTMFAPENGILNNMHPSQHVAALEAAEVAVPPRLLPCQTPFQNLSITPIAITANCASEEQRMLKAPDVMIFDTTRAQNFPNGRELTNDQVDTIAQFDPRVENVRRAELGGGSPTVNDVPLSDTFPYLGLPQ